MASISRREFVKTAALIGATVAWGRPTPFLSRTGWTERRDLFPEGVASGDPRPDSVILWTRRPGTDRAIPLTVEVAEDEAFTRVVAKAKAVASPDHDWTVRVLVGKLAPRTEYWYRFSDSTGAGSRIGRTVTAPRDDDAHPVNFAFISCQDVVLGSQHAYRRMIHEDERAAPADRLAFVLHLGDFIYEVTWYPEDRATYYDRTVKEVYRYPHGEKVKDLHIPTDVGDYRVVYRAYLHDADIQDARARFPFVNMWDNHEFSWNGWQSYQNFGAGNIPAQTRKVAAMQAWWEFQPARVATPKGQSLTAFNAPKVSNVAASHVDAHGLAQEPNNIAAINSLTGYRALRFGKHLDLIITDQHSYRSEDAFSRPEGESLALPDFLGWIPEDVQEILDAGRAYNGGNPPGVIRVGDVTIPNFRKNEPPQSILGETQKAWFLKQLKDSKATWKVWGNTQGTLDWRADLQNLPEGLTRKWPAGYAGTGGGDHGTAYVERGEIYDFVAREKITNFACVAGDRHSFWAGLMAKSLPPAEFSPVGVAFITGSISAAGLVEAYEHRLPKVHPLRPLYLIDRPGNDKPEPSVNMLLRHGVRSCLEYAASGDLAKARAVSNPDNAPHLEFIDMGGHGYAVVRVSDSAIESEFVCIPRPVNDTDAADGGPLRYRAVHRANAWAPGGRPKLEMRVIEGSVGLGA